MVIRPSVTLGRRASTTQTLDIAEASQTWSEAPLTLVLASALTAPVEEGVAEYLATPANFTSARPEVLEADAFRAAVDWTLAHTDWRVLGGLVPGMVEARHVRLGDAVRLSGGLSTVTAVRHHGRPGCVYVTAVTESGAPVVYELRTSERVHVLAAKAVQS